MLSLLQALQVDAPGVRAGRPWRSAFTVEQPLAAPAPLKDPRLRRLAEEVQRVQRRWRPAGTKWPSGLPELDAALGGGFEAGAIHELIAAREGTAAHSLALHVAGAAAAGKWLVYLDTTLDLYPPALAELGVALGRLLVVRAPRRADALWVCEQSLCCRAIGAVVLPLRNLDAYASRRLQLAAEAGGGLGLLIRREELGGPSFAASRLRLEPVAGPAGVRRLRVTVLKLREGRPREPLVVEWSDASNPVCTPAVPGDGAGPARMRASG